MASWANYIVGTVVAVALFRVPAAFIEGYITRRGRRTRIYVSHAVGGVLAAIVIFAARSQQYQGRPLFPGGLASGRAVAAVIDFYLILSLICLILAWDVTRIGSRRRRRTLEDRRWPPPPYALGQPQQPAPSAYQRPPPDPGAAVRSTAGVIVEAIGVSSSLAGLVLSFDAHHLGKAYLAGLVGSLSAIIVFMLKKSERA